MAHALMIWPVIISVGSLSAARATSEIGNGVAKATVGANGSLLSLTTPSGDATFDADSWALRLSGCVPPRPHVSTTSELSPRAP